MRPSRPRRALGGNPFGAVLGALVLAGAAAAAANGSAAAQPAPVEWIKNGEFRDPLARGWTCEGEFTQTDRGVEGRPGEQSYAGCTQRVPVVAGTRYSFSASMAGAYTFVTVSGTGTGSGAVTLWADGPNWRSLATTLVIGNSREVTVTFHGWYGQGPYQVNRVSMIGPMYPDECATPSPAPSVPGPSVPAPASTPPCLPRPADPPTGSV
ncbi:hypothetical protein ACFVGM_22040 [Kitasatospora purpeofusca]|uniref:hypothetical protein n=1 Tax=Kitasatospora purpeofusca TaxID=67352 RepID=UPI0036959365